MTSPAERFKFGTEVACRGPPLDDHLGVGHRCGRRCVGGQLGRLELLEVATSATGSALVGAPPPHPRASPPARAPRASGTTAGTTAGTSAVSTTSGTGREASPAGAARAPGTDPAGAPRAGTRAARAPRESARPARTRASRWWPSASGAGRRRDGLAGHRSGWAARGRRDGPPRGTGGRVDRRRGGRDRSGSGRIWGRGRHRSLGGGRAGDRGRPLDRRGGSRGHRSRWADRRCGRLCGRSGRSGRGGQAGRRDRSRLLGGRPAGDEPGARPLDRWGRRRSRRSGPGGSAWACGRLLGGADRFPVEVRRPAVDGGCGLLGRSLLRGRRLLGRGGGLLGLHRTAEPLPVSLATGAVRLGVLDRRRMALDAHAQGQAEVKRLLVGQTELMCEFVDPDLLRQRLLLPFISRRRCRYAHTTVHSRTSRDRTLRARPDVPARRGTEGCPQPFYLQLPDPGSERPVENPSLHRPLQARRGIPTEPRPPARTAAPDHQGTITGPGHPEQQIR